MQQPVSRFSKTPQLDISPGKNLTPAERQVEQTVSQRIQANPAAAISAYRQANTKNGTTIYNVTQGKEQFPEYSTSSETRTANGVAVHEPASALVNAAYQQHLTEPDVPGKASDVVMLAGGRAAGKTTTLGDDMGPLNDASIVWDTHMRDENDVRQKIKAAHDAGRNVQAIWVHRDPVDAFDGMIERAQRSGRVLPLDNFVDTHIDGPRNFLKLANEYEGDPRTTFGVIDNSQGPGNAVPGTLETLKDYA